MADLSKIADTYNPDEGAVLELNDAADAPLMNDDGTRMTLTLLGQDSDVVTKHNNQVSNRRLSAGARLKLTSEGLTGDGTALLAKATVGWNITLGGQKPALSYDAAFALYANPKLAFIREQADRFIADRAHFLKTSPTT